MTKSTIPIIVWFPCSKLLPDVSEETSFIVTCREWDIFENMWGRKEVRILSYSPKEKAKNIRTKEKIKEANSKPSK